MKGRQADINTDRQTDINTDKGQTERQTDTQRDRPTSRQADKLIERIMNREMDKKTNRKRIKNTEGQMTGQTDKVGQTAVWTQTGYRIDGQTDSPIRLAVYMIDLLDNRWSGSEPGTGWQRPNAG